MTEAVTRTGTCQVRSGTDSPCLGLAVVEIFGVPFCERCAREQERYFAIGELTQAREPELVEVLTEARRGSARRSIASRPLAEAAQR